MKRADLVDPERHRASIGSEEGHGQRREGEVGLGRGLKGMRSGEGDGVAGRAARRGELARWAGSSTERWTRRPRCREYLTVPLCLREKKRERVFFVETLPDTIFGETSYERHQRKARRRTRRSRLGGPEERDKQV